MNDVVNLLTLSFFDRNYDYGPCIGVTRLERWERAQAMGLNPPLEVLSRLNSLYIKLNNFSRFVISFSLVKVWQTKVTQSVSSMAKFKQV